MTSLVPVGEASAGDVEYSSPSDTVWTIGHSTRSAEELLDCLGDFGIELLVDVRRFPASRRLPQFSSAALELSVRERGLEYCWIEALGGRRRLVGDSTDSAWRNPAFHAYAEYLRGPEFADGLFELMMLAGGMRTAVMCSEVLWWRCHRRLISDVLVSLGYSAIHIFSPNKAEPHRLTIPARLVGGVLTYEPE